MKPLDFLSSVILTILILVGGATLASNLKGVEEIQTLVDEASTKSELLARKNHLSIELSGIRSSSGKVLVMVFDNSKAFASYDYNKAAGYQEVDATHETLNFNFSSLTDGPYAIFIMHDENNDHQLNQSDGYPMEGFVVSGAKSKYDEPTFKQAAVVKGEHKLKLVYF